MLYDFNQNCRVYTDCNFTLSHVARMVKVLSVYGSLVRKPKDKRLFLKSRRLWEINVKMDLKVV
jgi:hypothetical protein